MVKVTQQRQRPLVLAQRLGPRRPATPDRSRHPLFFSFLTMSLFERHAGPRFSAEGGGGGAPVRNEGVGCGLERPGTHFLAKS